MFQIMRHAVIAIAMIHCTPALAAPTGFAKPQAGTATPQTATDAMADIVPGPAKTKN